MRPDRLAILALLLPAALGAQANATITAVTDLRSAPGGRVLASLRVGAGVRTVAQSGSWSQVSVDGWLHESVIGPKVDSFALSVRSPNGALMRAAADRTGAVVAQLENGMGLQSLQRDGQWTHVQRVGWVLSKAVKAGAPPPPVAAKPAPAKPAAAPATAPVADAAVPPEAMPGDVAVARRTDIRTAPTGRPLGSLDSATRLTTGAEDRGWVKVTLEGWVKQADLVPLDSAALSAVSAADLRADPDQYRGQTLRWEVQVIAEQTADPLRKGLAPDEPYLLARGPGQESALLYLAIPPSLADAAKALKPLSYIVVIARVRSGRSDPSGVPILDLQRIIQR